MNYLQRKAHIITYICHSLQGKKGGCRIYEKFQFMNFREAPAPYNLLLSVIIQLLRFFLIIKIINQFSISLTIFI